MQQVSINGNVSEWGEVTSGVPQGSILGPILFIIYVNELPSLVSSKIKMFADDTKLFAQVKNKNDAQVLQNDLNILGEWSSKWLLKFNVSKCRVMHCGSANLELNYFMDQNGEPYQLECTESEKDLGVHVSKSLKPTLHCHKAANRAMSALKLLRIAFGTFTMTSFKPLYTVYVRPHLEYCVQAVGPYMVQDLSALEKVQRRATKLVHGLRHFSYQERLERLQLTSLKDRFKRGDMIETYKIMSGKLNVDYTHWFERNPEQITRGHRLKLKVRRAKNQVRGKFFSNRVVQLWNSLPEEVVTAESTNQFKNKLDKLQVKT